MRSIGSQSNVKIDTSVLIVDRMDERSLCGGLPFVAVIGIKIGEGDDEQNNQYKEGNSIAQAGTQTNHNATEEPKPSSDAMCGTPYLFIVK